VIGTFFFMKGFYFPAIDDDSHPKAKPEKILRETEEMIQSHYGILFKLTKQGDNYLHKVIGGGLLEDIGFTRRDVDGKTAAELLPGKAEMIETYYDFAWENNEKIVFEVEIGRDLFAISLRPLLENGEVAEMAGAVMRIAKYSRLERCVSPSQARA
jgi:hypothetical protein